MRFDKTTVDGLKIDRMVHDSKFPKGFVAITEDDATIKFETNPGLRELVLMRVAGQYQESTEHRYGVAFWTSPESELTRVPKTFAKRPEAEEFAINLASMYPRVLVTDINYRVAKKESYRERDYEAEENNMHEEDRPRHSFYPSGASEPEYPLLAGWSENAREHIQL